MNECNRHAKPAKVAPPIDRQVPGKGWVHTINPGVSKQDQQPAQRHHPEDNLYRYWLQKSVLSVLQ